MMTCEKAFTAWFQGRDFVHQIFIETDTSQWPLQVSHQYFSFQEDQLSTYLTDSVKVMLKLRENMFSTASFLYQLIESH